MKVLLTTLCLFSLLWACTKDKNKEKNEPILVGEFGSLTGSESSFGKSTHKGVQLAIDEINESGGVQGRQIKIITKDNQSRIDLTLKVVEDLITKDKVIALLGEVASSRTLSAAPIAQSSGTPLLTPSSTNPRVTEVGDFIFRACYVDPFQGEVMANFAFKDLKVKKVAVLKDDKSDYSRGLASFFIQTFKELGGKIVADENYKSGDIDFKEQLNFIKSENPQAIFIPGYYTEAALIARQIKKIGIKTLLLGGDGWDSPQLFEIGRDSVNGAYFTNHFNSDSKNPISKEFIKSFRKKYGHAPDGVAAMGYDAAKILAAALDRANPITKENVKTELANTKNFPGVTGNISIDEFRNGVKPSVIVKVEGPNNRFVTTVKPIKKP